MEKFTKCDMIKLFRCLLCSYSSEKGKHVIDSELTPSVIVGDVSGVRKHLVENVDADFRDESSLGRPGKFFHIIWHFCK